MGGNQDCKNLVSELTTKEICDLRDPSIPTISSDQVTDLMMTIHAHVDEGRPARQGKARNLSILAHIHRDPITNSTSNSIQYCRDMSADLLSYKRVVVSSLDRGSLTLCSIPSPYISAL